MFTLTTVSVFWTSKLGVHTTDQNQDPIIIRMVKTVSSIRRFNAWMHRSTFPFFFQYTASIPSSDLIQGCFPPCIYNSSAPLYGTDKDHSSMWKLVRLQLDYSTQLEMKTSTQQLSVSTCAQLNHIVSIYEITLLLYLTISLTTTNRPLDSNYNL